jgi:hypothetical protein
MNGPNAAAPQRVAIATIVNYIVPQEQPKMRKLVSTQAVMVLGVNHVHARNLVVANLANHVAMGEMI